MSFTIYPALDLREGRVVRLDQGDYGRETRYGHDPLATASAYAQAGARWLHVVDLDAARLGRFTQFAVLQKLIQVEGLCVQAGGGVRTRADVRALLDAGVARVVVGSISVRQSEQVAAWIAEFGAERICVALDTRASESGAYELPVSGWTHASGVPLTRLLDYFAGAPGARHVLCTDIERDGMMGGPNVGLYRLICQRYPSLAIQASGGVRDTADVRESRGAGAAGAIVGKALLEGRVTMPELLAC
jgi:phosphoribosylformimino-5-aminoimidazole carboxamide ribotide isomerase